MHKQLTTYKSSLQLSTRAFRKQILDESSLRRRCLAGGAISAIQSCILTNVFGAILIHEQCDKMQTRDKQIEGLTSQCKMMFGHKRVNVSDLLMPCLITRESMCQHEQHMKQKTMLTVIRNAKPAQSRFNSRDQNASNKIKRTFNIYWIEWALRNKKKIK